MKGPQTGWQSNPETYPLPSRFLKGRLPPSSRLFRPAEYDDNDGHVGEDKGNGVKARDRTWKISSRVSPTPAPTLQVADSSSTIMIPLLARWPAPGRALSAEISQHGLRNLWILRGWFHSSKNREHPSPNRTSNGLSFAAEPSQAHTELARPFGSCRVRQ